MKHSTVARNLARSIVLLFCFMIACMACIVCLAVRNLQVIERDQRAHAQSFVPAKRLAASFEREILNARIFFIYFVTIQKPGSLDSGWARYHNAEAAVHDLNLLVDKEADLANLRVPSTKLQADVESYGVTLAQVLSMVQGGEIKGPHYDAMVKQWAAKGAVMVGDAASLESLCFRSGEANSRDISRALRHGQTQAGLLFGISFLLSLALALLLTRKMRRLTHEQATDEIASAFSVPQRISTGII